MIGLHKFHSSMTDDDEINVLNLNFDEIQNGHNKLDKNSVKSINTKVGDVTISAGTNVSVTTTGNDIEISSSAGAGGGDVTGAASSTDNAITRFDGTTGKVIQNSGIIIDDSNNVTGMGTLNGRNLSTDSSKLDGIAIGAEVNVQSDWNALSGDAFILNKPTIPTQYTDENAQDAVGSILTDSSEIDLTYTDATPSITASLKAGSIDETKLDTSVNASLNKADSAIQTETDPVYSASQASNITATDITHLSNLSGINTGDQTSVTGNAGTATKLATARNINGVAFDGTANITVADSTKVPTTTTVNGHALSSNVTVTKGDVGLGNVDNTSDATKNSATATLTNKDLTSGTNTFPTLNQNTTGSAAKLTTARTIAGQSFDGTANISIGADDLSDVDTTTTAPTNGQVLSWDSGVSQWKPATVSGGGGGSGTVTSVAATVPTGMTVSGSPITTSGTLALGYDTGYTGYTSTEKTKLSGIEAGAEVNDVTSVAGKTGAVTLDASDLTATGITTSKYLRGDNTWQTPTNTTYAEVSDAEIVNTTSTTTRLISGRRAETLMANEATKARTLTNKILTSPAISTPTGIVKGDVGLGNVTNDAQVALAGTQTITGDKTFSGQMNGGITGELRQWSTGTAPSGWLMCQGQAISRTTYAGLFAVIGTNYGVGDGSTTFNLPNGKGNVFVGQDTSQTEFDTIGETGGAKTHTLTTAEMPSHDHSLVYGVNTSSPGNNVTIMAGGTAYSSRAPIANEGGGSAHNNLQPYQVIGGYIIKT